MAIFFGVVILILVLVFGVNSIMQSYASAQQAQAVVETAQAAQMATFANVVVIVVMALVLLLILAGIVYLVIRLNSKPRQDRRSQIQPERGQNRLDAGREYGRQLRQIQAENETKQSLGEPSTNEALLVIADDDQVDAFINSLFKDW